MLIGTVKLVSVLLCKRNTAEAKKRFSRAIKFSRLVSIKIAGALVFSGIIEKVSLDRVTMGNLLGISPDLISCPV